MRRWRLRGAVLTSTVVALSLAVPVAGAAAPPGPAPTVPAPNAAVAGTTTTVTLVTGDVVEYTVDRTGRRRVALAPAADPDRLGVSYLQIAEGDAHYVYPSDALPLVRAGRLDRTLFDVAYLARSGFGDDLVDELPVIAQYGAGVRAAGTLAARADALPASSDVTPLPSVHAAGFEVDKDQAGEFWSTLVGARNLRAGVTTLWLDRVVTPTLEHSVAQIGVPAAWERGLDGTGTTVAVLDTGIDLDHPDFAGRVVATRNFTNDPSVHDGFGHGTHVASILAGSGAASAGRYRGVAPGASLLVGKVLGDAGMGGLVETISGMEWAAANGADVVNMSLGFEPTDGTDPLSQAVNRLTAQYGTLFVIAAGNAGPAPMSVAAPSVADAALSVAAVDRDDELASFSSRGPRVGDYGLKPDIAAPGVGITAARSEPSIMGGAAGERYVVASGTSMASPHVAGAAAILAQQNPKWTAAELKPVLVSTARDAGHRSFEQGAGRLDLTRALNQRVYATNNLDFGKQAFPVTGPVRRSVRYVNQAAEPVTLDLAVSLSSDRGPAPAGMVRVDRDQVTVPANGTAEVTVTVDARLGAATWYEGALRASADGIEVGSAIGMAVEAESFAVTSELVLPSWLPASAVQGVVFTRDDGRMDRTMTAPGEAAVTTTVRLNAGPHTLSVLLGWFDEDGYNNGVAVLPEIEVTGDRTVRADLRGLRRIAVETPRDSQIYQSDFGVLRMGEGNIGGVQASAIAQPANGWDGWLLPTKKVTMGSLEVIGQHLLGAPPVEMSVAGRRGPELHPRYQSVDAPGVPRLDGRRTLRLVNGGTGTAAELAKVDARGALVLLDMSAACPEVTCGDGTVAQVAEAAKAGAAAVLGYGPTGHVQIGSGDWPTFAIPTMSIPTDEARALLSRLDRGAVRVDTDARAVSPYEYQLSFAETGQVPRDVTHEVRERELYRIDHRFHSDAPGIVLRRYSAKHADLAAAGVINTVPRRARTTLVEYIGPVSDKVLWDRSLSYNYDKEIDGWINGPVYSSHDVFSRSGQRTEAWNSRPLSSGPFSPAPAARAHPWEVPPCYDCRAGNTLVVDTATVDPFGHASTYASRVENYRLTRGDQEFERKQRGYLISAVFFVIRIPVDTFDVPASPGTYRLEHQATGGMYAQLRYSTKEDTTYTFRSQRPTSRAEPCVGQQLLNVAEPCAPDKILRLRYDTRLDLANQAPAGRSQRISVRAFYGNGLDAPRLRSLRLWASADDGRTWREVRTHHRHGEFTGVIQHPRLSRTTGAITLRATAVDVAGNTIDQTIHRAYGLR